jgi:hypothetical protein
MFKLNKYHIFLYLPHGFVAVSYILPFYTTIPRPMMRKPEVQWKNMVFVDYIGIFFYISEYFWQVTVLFVYIV